MVICETERLYLREWVPDDWKRFRPLATDPRVLPYIDDCVLRDPDTTGDGTLDERQTLDELAVAIGGSAQPLFEDLPSLRVVEMPRLVE